MITNIAKNPADFTLPSVKSLLKGNALAQLMDDMYDEHEGVEDGHRQGLYRVITNCYGVSQLIQDDPKLFAAFTAIPAINGLPRKVKSPKDVWRAFMGYTIGDPKKASKYQRRLQPLWKERKAPTAVLEFLQKHGIEKRPEAGGRDQSGGHDQRATMTVRTFVRDEALVLKQLALGEEFNAVASIKSKKGDSFEIDLYWALPVNE